ncbi:MAG: CGNR zinc finger domain-containing protein [Capsulimonas sp.]|uniref:CGNR zinc finger domain-containing protein n=1 Tax=Capsulimonas sp. TaxID=2494211 RepID=UPI003265DD45
MSDLILDTEAMFAGGRLCLDFINTACLCRGVEIEFIGSGEELRQWVRMAETIFGRRLCGDGGAEYWEGALPQAIALRSALRDIVHSVLEQTPPPAQALQTVNAVLESHPTYFQIGYDAQSFQESLLTNHPSEKWLSTIAADAVDLLCHANLSLLRQCACPTCVRVFYDTTKNHKRRWCVEKCGSAPKAAAYYRRKVGRAAQTEPAAVDALQG